MDMNINQGMENIRLGIRSIGKTISEVVQRFADRVRTQNPPSNSTVATKLAENSIKEDDPNVLRFNENSHSIIPRNIAHLAYNPPEQTETPEKELTNLPSVFEPVFITDKSSNRFKEFNANMTELLGRPVEKSQHQDYKKAIDLYNNAMQEINTLASNSHADENSLNNLLDELNSLHAIGSFSGNPLHVIQQMTHEMNDFIFNSKR